MTGGILDDGRRHMGEPLKHHYIPRFYLSAWCGRDGRVTYYRVERGRLVAKRISPKGTGYENRLYTIEAGPQDLRRLIEQNRDSGREPSKSLRELFQSYLDSGIKDAQFLQMFETNFTSVIDDRASKVLNKIRAGAVSALTHRERLDWTEFLMSLPLRNPETLAEIKRNSWNSMLDDAAERFRSEFKGKIDDEEIEEMDSLLRRSLSANEIFQHVSADDGLSIIEGIIREPYYQKQFASLTWWTVDFSAAKHSALTSDRPYVQLRPLDHPKLLIYLPVGPKLGFFASSDPKIRDNISRQDVNFVVSTLNHFVVRFASRYVYGTDKSHLRFIENRWRQTSKLGLHHT
jgi:Protein of unknown function (DUF4238)